MRVKRFGEWGVALLLATVHVLGAGSDAPLADAAQNMDRERIRALLQRPIEVNAPQVDGMTALHWAAYQDDLETAQLLVRAGANVKAATRYGVTPLSLACQNGSGAMVELLLDAGAEPNTALPGGETALMTAARTGKVQALKALLARGADVHRQVQGLGGPQVQPGAAAALARGADVPRKEGRGQTALMWATAEGHPDVVEELIKAGADFRTPLDSGFTPLLFAVREGRIGVVQALLKAGVDVNEAVQPEPSGQRRGYRARLRAGTTPLLLAVANAHYELAALLLDAGADPNAGLTGYTALHAIAPVRKPGVGDNDPAPPGSGNMSSIELVKKLAAQGANLNARMTKRVDLTNTRLNELGATPFLLASQTADAELMKTLAALGADPLLPNADNSTPLIVAAGLATRSPGEDAGTESEVLEAVQVALDLGNDINAVDNNGDTAMHGAAYKNLPKVVQLLAEKGANINIWYKENKYGWTPLTIAVGYRFGNFKPSPETEAALRQVMIAAGVTPPTTVTGKTQQIY